LVWDCWRSGWLAACPHAHLAVLEPDRLWAIGSRRINLRIGGIFYLQSDAAFRSGSISVCLFGWYSSSGASPYLFRLIIPGCLLITIGPSIYLAWGTPGDQNILTRTGDHAGWFCPCWLLITILSRHHHLKFIWWPSFPGDAAMVGWGVYMRAIQIMSHFYW